MIIHLQVVNEHYERKRAEDGPTVIVTITGDQVGVDIGDDGVNVNGWSLTPLATPKVLHLSTWLQLHSLCPIFTPPFSHSDTTCHCG